MVFKRFSLKCFHVFFLIVIIANNSFSQSDSTNLSFDFGITRGRNINLWPVFKKFKNIETSELQVAYPLFSKEINYKLQTKHLQFIPFVFSDSSSQGIDKRFLSLYYPSVFHFQKQYISNSNISYFKFLELAPNISCLGISRAPNGLFVENNMFFFIWYKRDMLLSKTHFIIFPAYWYFSNKVDTTHVLFPLYWASKSNVKTNKLILPFVYSFRNQNYSSLTVLPFFSVGHSPNLSISHFVIFPLYWHYQTSISTNNIVFPFWFGNKTVFNNDTISKKVLFPFYWSVKSKEKNNSVVFPLVYIFKNRYYNSTTVLPFLSVGHSADLSKHHFDLIPIYWHSETKENMSNVVFPLWWSKSEYYYNDTISNKSLFPIYWSVNSKLIHNYFYLPFVYKVNNLDWQSFTFLPFYSYGQAKASDNKYLAITPFYWRLTEKNKIKNIVLPLFWNKREYSDYDTLKRSTFFPIYWSVKTNAKNHQILFPLVFKTQNYYWKTLTVVPLFSYGKTSDLYKKYVVITPLYWHINKGYSQRNILFPIIWSNRKASSYDTVKRFTVFPIYWSIKRKDKNNKILLPIYFNLNDDRYQSFTILPLFSSGHSTDYTEQHFDLFPFYWHNKTKWSVNNVIFPLWWNNKNHFYGDTVTRKILFPLYYSVNAGTIKKDIFFPLVYSFKNSYRTSLTVLPFFSYRRSLDSSSWYLAITPFYWHTIQEHRKRDILFPVIWSKREYYDNDTLLKNTVFPIYWSIKNKYKNNKVLFPIVYSFRDKYYKSLTIFPLFSKGNSTDSTERYFDLFPIFWHYKTKQSSNNLLFPIWWSNSKFKNDDTISQKFLLPVYWSNHSKLKNDYIFFPLIYKFSNQERKSLTVFPLFSYNKTIDSSNNGYMAITPLFWHFKAKNETKNILFPIYWATKSMSKNNKILFPIIYSLNNNNYYSFTFLPLFSFGHSANHDKTHLMITPLAGIFNSPVRTNMFLFPVINYNKTQLETNTSAMLFLYRRTNKPNYSKTSIIWPICERQKYENYSYFRIAPFVWYLKTDSSKMFSLQPFQYSYNSNYRKTFIFAWFVYRYDNTKGYSVSNSVMWKLFNSEKFANGDFEKRFLYFVYVNLNKQGKQEQSILPFYHNILYSNGDKSKSVMFSFYNYFKQYIPEINESYEEERIFWFLRLRSNFAKLKSEGKEKYLKRK